MSPITDVAKSRPTVDGCRVAEKWRIIDKPLIQNDLEQRNPAESHVTSLPADFLRHVRVDGECWLWTGTTNHQYGHFRGIGAHRAAYQFAYGAIPPSQCVLHRCDRPLCVNPAHLFLGTRAENCLDRAAKQRSAHKLTDEQVRAIRQRDTRIPGKWTGIVTALAAEYGVSRSTISLILRGQRRQRAIR